MRGGLDRGRRRGEQRLRLAAGLDHAEVGGPGEGLVAGQQPAVGQPLGPAPRAALGDDVERTADDVEHDQVGHALAIAHADQPVAVRVPGQVGPVVALVGELALARRRPAR